MGRRTYLQEKRRCNVESTDAVLPSHFRWNMACTRKRDPHHMRRAQLVIMKFGVVWRLAWLWTFRRHIERITRMRRGEWVGRAASCNITFHGVNVAAFGHDLLARQVLQPVGICRARSVLYGERVARNT